ncbi:MAG: hypothetical protein FGM41_03240 [Bacteroidetes bacterium]|nr:hypothetical protein [Bacteroidota bacterium]
MKKKKIKLELNKETIEVLDEMQLNCVHGGTNATVVETIRGSSLKCAADAYGYATVVNDAGKAQSWWGCPYKDENAKSEYVPFGQRQTGQLDNTNVNVPGGAWICIKPY